MAGVINITNKTSLADTLSEMAEYKDASNISLSGMKWNTGSQVTWPGEDGVLWFPNLVTLTISGVDPLGILHSIHARKLKTLNIIFDENSSALNRKGYNTLILFITSCPTQLFLERLTVSDRHIGDRDVAMCLGSRCITRIPSVDLSFPEAGKRWIRFMTNTPTAVQELGGNRAHDFIMWLDRTAKPADRYKAHLGWFTEGERAGKDDLLRYTSTNRIFMWRQTTATKDPWNVVQL